MIQELDQFHELTIYTLAHPDPAFIHQHAVDAYAAQNADVETKPITLVFGLIGLYLHLEKGYTGKQVQRAHMQMARVRKKWVSPGLVVDRGSVHVAEVLAEEPGPARDAKIHQWCASVWGAWKEHRSQIAELARIELGVE